MSKNHYSNGFVVRISATGDDNSDVAAGWSGTTVVKSKRAKNTPLAMRKKQRAAEIAGVVGGSGDSSGSTGGSGGGGGGSSSSGVHFNRSSSASKIKVPRSNSSKKRSPRSDSKMQSTSNSNSYTIGQQRVGAISKYSKRRRACIATTGTWSTVVSSFIPPPSFKPVSLLLSRSPLF